MIVYFQFGPGSDVKKETTSDSPKKKEDKPVKV